MMKVDIPIEMNDRPVDEKTGRHIPWFATIVNGVPNFKAFDVGRRDIAVKEKLCSMCGKKLNTAILYVLTGGLGLKDKWVFNAPMHRGCALYAIYTYPWIDWEHGTGKRGSIPYNHTLPKTIYLVKVTTVKKKYNPDWKFSLLAFKPRSSEQFDSHGSAWQPEITAIGAADKPVKNDTMHTTTETAAPAMMEKKARAPRGLRREIPVTELEDVVDLSGFDFTLTDHAAVAAKADLIIKFDNPGEPVGKQIFYVGFGLSIIDGDFRPKEIVVAIGPVNGVRRPIAIFDYAKTAKLNALITYGSNDGRIRRSNIVGGQAVIRAVAEKLMDGLGLKFPMHKKGVSCQVFCSLTEIKDGSNDKKFIVELLEKSDEVTEVPREVELRIATTATEQKGLAPVKPVKKGTNGQVHKK